MIPNIRKFPQQTEDTTIDAVCKIPEETILAQWAESIPSEFRAGRRAYFYVPSPKNARKSEAEAAYARRSAKQAVYAGECTPKEDGDDTIIRLFGEGMRLGHISEVTGRLYEEVRRRLLACHPLGKPLR